MTRATETQHKRLQAEYANGKHLYATHLMMRDVVQLHRFYVPDKDAGTIAVLGLWRENLSENLLLCPVALSHLNTLQQWFSWGTMWGMRIELERQEDLTVEVTLKVDRPYLESKLDEAYLAWLKKYPHGSPESWGAYAAQHVREGRVECEIGSCDEPVVTGSTCCAAHQKFA